MPALPVELDSLGVSPPLGDGVLLEPGDDGDPVPVEPVGSVGRIDGPGTVGDGMPGVAVSVGGRIAGGGWPDPEDRAEPAAGEPADG